MLLDEDWLLGSRFKFIVKFKLYYEIQAQSIHDFEIDAQGRLYNDSTLCELKTISNSVNPVPPKIEHVNEFLMCIFIYGFT